MFDFLEKESYDKETDSFLFTDENNLFTNPADYIKEMMLIVSY